MAEELPGYIVKALFHARTFRQMVKGDIPLERTPLVVFWVEQFDVYIRRAILDGIYPPGNDAVPGEELNMDLLTSHDLYEDNLRLRRALEWYAEQENWELNGRPGAPAIRDGGQRARSTLAPGKYSLTVVRPEMYGDDTDKT